MELRHIRYFVAVAEEENVTRAAARLHVSQPALSRQVRDLEDALGVTLFDRGAKSLRLSEAGRVFLLEAYAVLERVDQAVGKVRAVGGGIQGDLRVAYAPSPTVELLPRALRSFQSDFPKVRVILRDLSTEQMLAGLHDGSLDVALMVEPRAPKLRGLQFEELACYPLCLAVAHGHELAGHDSVPVSRLAREPLIAYTREDYPEYHEDLHALFAAAGVEPQIAEEHESVSSLIAAVEASRGVALVPGCLTCMAGPRLKILPLAASSASITVGAAWREGNAAPAVHRFIAAARARE